MKPFALLLILLALDLTTYSQVETDYLKRSEQIFTLVRAKEFGKIMADFDSSLAKQVDSVRLLSAWNSLLERVGNFVKVTETTTEKVGKHDVVIQKSEFEKRAVDFKLVYGENGKIKGIFFVPEVKKFVFTNPDYLDSSRFYEKRMYLTTGEYRLPAILTMPRNVVRPPVLILVHGSGPNDKDETVGNTKIFRDISVGLAAQGIAVLRYDKRTRNYGSRMPELMRNLTVKEETMDDVLSAIKLMKQDSTLDAGRVYLAGHSLGGMLLPRIAMQTKDISGLILMAANARPIEDLMLEQMNYLSAGDSASEELVHMRDSMQTEVARIKKLTKSNAQDSIGILGIPVSYWLDLKSYDQVASASKLKLPILILQGNRDYQVTLSDFALWQSGLNKNKNVSFRSYEKLNHFFIAGEGKSHPDEYDNPGHFDKQVIDDMSTFILKGF